MTKEQIYRSSKRTLGWKAREKRMQRIGGDGEM